MISATISAIYDDKCQCKYQGQSIRKGYGRSTIIFPQYKEIPSLKFSNCLVTSSELDRPYFDVNLQNLSIPLGGPMLNML